MVPLVTAGLGVALKNINDRRTMVDEFGKGARRTPAVEVDETSIAGAIGVGIEYFLNHNISVAFALPFYIYPDWDTSVQQRNKAGGPVGPLVRSSYNFSGVTPMVRLTAYIP